MAVEALVGVWVMLNGHWAKGGMDQWTPVLWGRTWEPENREGSGLQTSFLSTSSHSVGLLSQGAEASGGRLWEEIPVQLRGGLSSLLEARQLINSQLARCFLSKVDIFLSVFLSYQQYNISEDRKLWYPLLYFFLCPPHFQSHRALRKGRVKVSFRSQFLEIESLIHLELPSGCHGNTTSATQLCSSGHWVWHTPSCCWFCVLPDVLLCSPRNASHFFSKGTLIQKAGLWREGRLNQCKLQFWESNLSACGAINSANLWINVLHLLISNPTENHPPRFILLTFVSKEHTLFIKTSVRCLKYI